MSMKRLFIALVLFGLLFSDIAGPCFADIPAQLQQAETYSKNGQYKQAEAIYKQIVTDYAFRAQKNLAILYVTWNRQSQAEAALQKLVANFSQHEAIATAVTHVADAYRKLERDEKACEIYNYVVDNWPRDEHAMWSQMGLVISNTCLGNEEAAEAAFAKLCSNYSGQELLGRAICIVADNYRKLDRDEKAREVYQVALDNQPDPEFTLWSRKGLAISNIRLGDFDAAGADADKLRADFAEDERMAIAGCLIADEYRKMEKYQEACEIYNYVVDNWPDAEHAMWSQVNIGNIKLQLDDDRAARVIFDKVLADFAGHPILPEAADQMAYGYYRKALLKRKEGFGEQANWYYQQTITECERIITQLPETRYITAEACYFSGVCYGRLGQHEKAIEYYQKVVDNWPEYKSASSAQFRIAKTYKWLLRFGVMSDSEAEAAMKVAFEHLVEKFPDCPAASAAHKWLNYYHKKPSEGGQK